MKSSLILVSVWVYIWLFNRYTLVARRLIRSSPTLDLTLVISNSIFSDPIFQYLKYNTYIYIATFQYIHLYSNIYIRLFHHIGLQPHESHPFLLPNLARPIQSLFSVRNQSENKQKPNATDLYLYLGIESERCSD